MKAAHCTERALSAPAPLAADHELDQFSSGTPPLPISEIGLNYYTT